MGEERLTFNVGIWGQSIITLIEKEEKTREKIKEENKNES